MAESMKPVAWMRLWAFNGEEPRKEKKENSRMAWPLKFKLAPVTKIQCLPDDVPLYAAAQLEQVTKTLRQVTAIAHNGGLAELSEAEALIVIRGLTRHLYNSHANIADAKCEVLDALITAKEKSNG